MDNPCLLNICVAWRKALRLVWNVPNIKHNRVIILLTDSALRLAQLKAIFIKCLYKAATSVYHSNYTINHVTKYVCRNPKCVCG